MLSIDQFESAFRAAARRPFHPAPVLVERVMVVTDLDPARSAQYIERARPLLAALGDPELVAVPEAESRDLEALLAAIQAAPPQLIVSYRCLHSPAWRLPYTVGDHIEVLTQVTDVPVLLLPRVDTGHATEAPLLPPRTVMAMTDHLVGDDALVSWAARLASERLVLAHVEDDVSFQHTMHHIERIPELPTDLVRRKLSEMMLEEPREWIGSCRQQLSGELEIVEAVLMGSRLATYRGLLTEHGADLLVLNTRDDDQLAIHGMAWPLMIELRDVPLLLL